MSVKKELKLIQEQFNKVIAYSQNIPNPKTDKLFETWLNKKRDIIEIFGGKLIYEVEGKVHFELTDEAKRERVNCFIDELWNLGYVELGDFVLNQRESFYKNIVETDYIIYTHKDGSKNTTIKKNTKLVRAFKYFIEDKDILNKLQIKASQLIQEDKVEGTLCFSVHPLDYLSISENNHNWRSCHALDGEYRAGNLSYMVDKSTIICYLKSDGLVKLPHFPEDVLWNNKKWRVLLYLSNDWNMIFSGKQYPFSTDSGMKILTQIFNTSQEWTDWSDYSIKGVEHKLPISIEFHNEYIPLSDKLVALNKLVKNGEGSKQFNDVLSSSCYTPMYCYRTYEDFWCPEPQVYAKSSTTKFEIGGMTTCLRCGQEEVVDCCDTMMCYDCEFEYGTSVNDTFCFCERCGARIKTDDSYYVDQENYCEYCYDNYAAKCECCGDSYPIESLTYNEVDDAYYCEWCMKTN